MRLIGVYTRCTRTILADVDAGNYPASITCIFPCLPPMTDYAGGSIYGSAVRLEASSLVLSSHAAVHADGLGFFSGSTGAPPLAGCGPGGGVPDALGGR